MNVEQSHDPDPAADQSKDDTLAVADTPPSSSDPGRLVDDVKPVVPLTRRQTVITTVITAVVGGGCGVAMVVVATWLVLNVVSCVRAPKAPTPPAAAPASWSEIVAEVRQQYADVIDGEYADGLLMIRVAGDWTDLGATRLACETVKPILASHGQGGQLFAIYDRHGSVIATGSRCP